MQCVNVCERLKPLHAKEYCLCVRERCSGWVCAVLTMGSTAAQQEPMVEINTHNGGVDSAI